MPHFRKMRRPELESSYQMFLQIRKSVSTFKASIKAVKTVISNIERLKDCSQNHCSKNNVKRGKKLPVADINEIHKK